MSSQVVNHPTNAPNPDYGGPGQVIGILAVAALIGALFSAVWLRLMQRLQGRVVKASLIGNAAIVAVTVIVSLTNGAWPLAVLLLIYIGILGVWCWFIRSRIPMAEATLAAASRSLLDNHGPIVVVYLMAVLLLLFSSFWAFTFAAVFFEANTVTAVPDPNYPGQYLYQPNPTTPAMKVAFTFLIFSFYWTSQVFTNISHGQ
jgi:hypothetical protein